MQFCMALCAVCCISQGIEFEVRDGTFWRLVLINCRNTATLHHDMVSQTVPNSRLIFVPFSALSWELFHSFFRSQKGTCLKFTTCCDITRIAKFFYINWWRWIIAFLCIWKAPTRLPAKMLNEFAKLRDAKSSLSVEGQRCVASTGTINTNKIIKRKNVKLQG